MTSKPWTRFISLKLMCGLVCMFAPVAARADHDDDDDWDDDDNYHVEVQHDHGRHAHDYDRHDDHRYQGSVTYYRSDGDDDDDWDDDDSYTQTYSYRSEPTYGYSSEYRQYRSDDGTRYDSYRYQPNYRSETYQTYRNRGNADYGTANDTNRTYRYESRKHSTPTYRDRNSDEGQRYGASEYDRNSSSSREDGIQDDLDRDSSKNAYGRDSNSSWRSEDDDNHQYESRTYRYESRSDTYDD